MIRNDVRESHEKEYKELNELPLSICSGRFYYSNKKDKFIQCQHCQKCHKYRRYMMRLEDVPYVKFRHVESFRRCELYKQIINEDFVRTISIFSSLFVNDLACSSILEILDYMEEKDKESQKIYKALSKRMHAYERFINEIIECNGNCDDFADFNGLMEDEVAPVLEELYDMVDEEFKNNGVEDHEYLSKVEVSRALVKYSIFSINTRIEECRRYGIDLVYLHRYKLADINKVMDSFSDWALRKVGKIDLTQDKFVLKMHELGKKLTNYKKLTEFIDKTIDKQNFK